MSEVSKEAREAADNWRREWKDCRGEHTALVQAFARFEEQIDARHRETIARLEAERDALWEALKAEDALRIAERAHRDATRTQRHKTAPVLLEAARRADIARAALGAGQ